MTGPPVHVSLACWPGLRHDEAAKQLRQPLQEPLLGTLSAAHVQLVPQSFGTLTEEAADDIKAAHPSTQFRLHANVRVLRQHRLADLSVYAAHQDWFRQAARISLRLRAPAYTAHPGRRCDATLVQAIDNARRCVDLFGCPVGIEGQYPGPGDPLLVSTWHEYRHLFESGAPYAIDLSHLNILVTYTGERNDALLHEMLSCERCLEVHVSANDGRGDRHQICSQPTWWLPFLDFIHPKAVVFSEGNHRRTRTPA